MASISVECECLNNFTCGYCCRNAKPWLDLTAADCQPSEAKRARHRAEQDRARAEEARAGDEGQRI